MTLKGAEKNAKQSIPYISEAKSWVSPDSENRQRTRARTMIARDNRQQEEQQATHQLRRLNDMTG